MRPILFILIIAVAAILIAVATGFLNIRQTRPANVPDVSATRNGVSARGGQVPTFDIETGSVAVGTTKRTTNVTVPTVTVVPPDNQQENAAGNSAG